MQEPTLTSLCRLARQLLGRMPVSENTDVQLFQLANSMRLLHHVLAESCLRHTQLPSDLQEEMIRLTARWKRVRESNSDILNDADMSAFASKHWISVTPSSDADKEYPDDQVTAENLGCDPPPITIESIEEDEEGGEEHDMEEAASDASSTYRDSEEVDGDDELDTRYNSDVVAEMREENAWASMYNYALDHWQSTRSFTVRRTIIDDLSITLVEALDTMIDLVFDDTCQLVDECEHWLYLVCLTVQLITEFGVTDKHVALTVCGPAAVMAEATEAEADDDDDDDEEFSWSSGDSGERAAFLSDLYRMLLNFFSSFREFTVSKDEVVDGDMEILRYEMLNRNACLQTATALLLLKPLLPVLPEAHAHEMQLHTYLCDLAAHLQSDPHADLLDRQLYDFSHRQDADEALLPLVIDALRVFALHALQTVRIAPISASETLQSPATPSLLLLPLPVYPQLGADGVTYLPKLVPSEVVCLSPPEDLVRSLLLKLHPDARLMSWRISSESDARAIDELSRLCQLSDTLLRDASACKGDVVPVHSNIPACITTRQSTCAICREVGEQGVASLLCDQCDRMVHNDCLSSPLLSRPIGSWNCDECTRARWNLYSGCVALQQTCGPVLILSPDRRLQSALEAGDTLVWPSQMASQLNASTGYLLLFTFCIGDIHPDYAAGC